MAQAQPGDEAIHWIGQPRATLQSRIDSSTYVTWLFYRVILLQPPDPFRPTTILVAFIPIGKMASQQTSPIGGTFALFSRLPLELQIKIWAEAAAEDADLQENNNVIEVLRKKNDLTGDDYFTNEVPIPSATLHTCINSRTEAQKIFQRVEIENRSGDSTSTGTIKNPTFCAYIDFGRHVIVFNNDHAKNVDKALDFFISSAYESKIAHVAFDMNTIANFNEENEEWDVDNVMVGLLPGFTNLASITVCTADIQELCCAGLSQAPTHRRVMRINTRFIVIEDLGEVEVRGGIEDELREIYGIRAGMQEAQYTDPDTVITGLPKVLVRPFRRY
ncbi:hypothetical protein NHQ30_005464 [Ciborinia camelliae]|nr:hypothetical protein NHQ30_005464 [Ciborinia camelliae]